MNDSFVVRHLEALVELYRARIALTVGSWRRVLDDARTPAGVDPGACTDPEAIAGRIERAIRRVDRFCPATTCIHRAVAGQRMLTRRQMAARVVIGLRKRADLEGHAWVEADGLDSVLRLFAGDEAGYEPVR